MKGFFTPSRWLFLISFYMLIFQGLFSQSARPEFVDELPPLCSGDLFTYRIFNPGVSYWEWSFSPEWAVPLFEDSGPNGSQIISQLFNPTLSPVLITGSFIGYMAGTQEIITKKINFWVRPKLSCLFDQDIPFDQSNDKLLRTNFQRPTDYNKTSTIKERSLSREIRNVNLYPNPASDYLTIQYPMPDVPLRMIISRSDGKTIRSIELKDNLRLSYTIDLDDLETGVYFVTMVFSAKISSASFVVE